MVGHGGSSAGSYLADPTSPIPSHCASIVATSTLRVNTISCGGQLYGQSTILSSIIGHEHTLSLFEHVKSVQTFTDGIWRSQEQHLQVQQSYI